jgi:hypothetical protein
MAGAGERRLSIWRVPDKTLQPMLLRAANDKSKRPLLVGLHSWSGDYRQAGGEVVYAR